MVLFSYLRLILSEMLRSHLALRLRDAHDPIFLRKIESGLVAQLVRAPPCHGGGRGFEPHPGRHICFCVGPADYASVAQLVEQGTENRRVVGSIPTGGTILCGFSSFGRARPCQGRGGGFETRNPLQVKRLSAFCRQLF